MSIVSSKQRYSTSSRNLEDVLSPIEVQASLEPLCASPRHLLAPRPPHIRNSSSSSRISVERAAPVASPSPPRKSSYPSSESREQLYKWCFATELSSSENDIVQAVLHHQNKYLLTIQRRGFQDLTLETKLVKALLPLGKKVADHGVSRQVQDAYYSLISKRCRVFAENGVGSKKAMPRCHVASIPKELLDVTKRKDKEGFAHLSRIWVEEQMRQIHLAGLSFESLDRLLLVCYRPGHVFLVVCYLIEGIFVLYDNPSETEDGTNRSQNRFFKGVPTLFALWWNMEQAVKKEAQRNVVPSWAKENIRLEHKFTPNHSGHDCSIIVMQLVEQITRNPSRGAIIQYCTFPTDEDSIFNARQRIMHCLVTGSLPFLYDVWLDLSQEKEFLLSNPGKKPDVEFWCAALQSGEVLRKYYRDGSFNLAYQAHLAGKPLPLSRVPSRERNSFARLSNST